MFYELKYPEFIDSKIIDGMQGEHISLENMCLVDWMPRPIAEFIFSDENLRNLVESDYHEREVWGPDSFMKNQMLFEKRVESALRVMNFFIAVENYIYFMHNRVEFTTGVQKMQSIVLLNTNEMQKMQSPNKQEITPLEAALITAITDELPDCLRAETAFDESGFKEWITALRVDKQVQQSETETICALQKHIPSGKCAYEVENYLDNEEVKAKLPLARKIRDYFRQRSLFSSAARMSEMLKEPEEDLKDRISGYSRYEHEITGAEKLDMIRDILMLAKYNKRDDIVNEWIELYAREQKRLDGRFSNEQYACGWMQLADYYGEYSHTWYKSAERRANPLLVEFAQGFGFISSMKEEDRLDIVRRLGAKTNIHLDDLRTFWKRYATKDTISRIIKESENKFSAAMKAAGIELEEEHN